MNDIVQWYPPHALQMLPVEAIRAIERSSNELNTRNKKLGNRLQVTDSLSFAQYIQSRGLDADAWLYLRSYRCAPSR